jgi:WhiB family redox-sensing transcriptional regulator
MTTSLEASPASASQLLTRQDWRNWAKCLDTDPEFFFPVAVQMRAPAWREAKAFCVGCPVASECLIDALKTDALHGVRGGLDQEQLRELARSRSRNRSTA